MSKDIYDIKDREAYNDFIDYIQIDKPSIIKVDGNIIETDEYIFEVSEEYPDLLDLVQEAPEFDISSYSTKVIENSGYKFKTF